MSISLRNIHRICRRFARSDDASGDVLLLICIYIIYIYASKSTSTGNLYWCRVATPNIHWMPTVLCLKAYFVKSDLAMYDEDQVAAAIQIIHTERPLFTTLWIVWHCLAFKYLKHLSQIILSVVVNVEAAYSANVRKNEHELCAKATSDAKQYACSM